MHDAKSVRANGMEAEPTLFIWRGVINGVEPRSACFN